MIERLPTPWGLVRSGVAPDHPKIKSVTRVYEKTAAHPRFRFFGNVELGRDVSREELLEHYHASSTRPARRPTVRSASPARSSRAATRRPTSSAGTTATPTTRDHEFDLSAERAVVIGNGNVALDVARMLTLTPTSWRSPTSPTTRSSARRERCARDRRRRPPRSRQAAFTNPELLELGELADADVIVDPRSSSVPWPSRPRRGPHIAAQRLGLARLRWARTSGEAQARDAALPALPDGIDGEEGRAAQS